MKPITAKEIVECVTGTAPEPLERLVQMAERAGASDIHLQMRGPTAEVGFRLDGVLAPVTTLDENLAERVFGRIKFIARLKTYQDTMPQDGRIDAAELKSRQRHLRSTRRPRHPTADRRRITDPGRRRTGLRRRIPLAAVKRITRKDLVHSGTAGLV